MNPFDREASMTALVRALPYIQLFKNRTFVVKAGGALCGDPTALRSVMEQLAVLRGLGIRIVLVHGGGPQTTQLSEALGVSTSFVEGRRVTSDRTLEVAVMTLNGTINTAFLATCRAVAIPAIGLSGLDAGLIRAVRRPPQRLEADGERRTIDYGLVGDIVSVDTSSLETLLDAGLLPVISPLSADEQGQLLNINADTVASTLACALKAEKLIFLTDTAGLLEDPKDPASLISYLDLPGLARLHERGAIGSGMLPKVQAASKALDGGVRRVHMVGWKNRVGLLVELFTNEGSGTLLVKEITELSSAELPKTETGTA